MNFKLSADIASLPGIGPRYQNLLAQLKITTVRELFFHFPSQWEDRRQTYTGKLIKTHYIPTRSKITIQKASLHTSIGIIHLTWFNQPWIIRSLKPNQKITVFGPLKRSEIINPVIGLSKNSFDLNRIVPIYPQTKGITSKFLRNKIFHLLQNFSIKDPLNLKTKKKFNLISLKKAIQQIHFPDSYETLQQAQSRLAFDELLQHQLNLSTRHSDLSKVSPCLKPSPLTKNFIQTLPFKLTTDQQKTWQKITHDLKQKTPMRRLLLGDVGSGKTVVATLAAYQAFLNKTQTIFLCPTEILAFQHYQTIKELFKKTKLKPKITLLTSSTTRKTQNHQKNTPDIIISTHAILFQKNQHLVDPKKFGLLIIDEQHRFGVKQRKKLLSHQHLLSLTATPIPRSIALTLFGDLDLSFINQMPKGRTPIKTWLIPEEKRHKAYQWIKDQITKQKTQAFIICPFIKKSDSELLTQVKAATKEFEQLKSIFSEFKLDLLHGKITSTKKQQILKKMQKGKIDILVTTPVIEVGIDIPNANIMIIESAERFGLSQLHQMRGRVGRRQQQAYCLLFANQEVKRLNYLTKINSGPELAKLDLKLRGPGELIGLKQHGFLGFRFARLDNLELIKQTHELARDIIKCHGCSS